MMVTINRYWSNIDYADLNLEEVRHCLAKIQEMGHLLVHAELSRWMEDSFARLSIFFDER